LGFFPELPERNVSGFSEAQFPSLPHYSFQKILARKLTFHGSLPAGCFICHQWFLKIFLLISPLADHEKEFPTKRNRVGRAGVLDSPATLSGFL
jgi:hypothetical protein